MAQARMRGFKSTTSPERALELLLGHLDLKQLDSESVPIDAALGRVLAKDVVAEIDIPAFDRAAMDGYAVVAEDTFGASQTNPALLRLVSENVSRGEAAEVYTGSPIPRWANAVVMLEYVRKGCGGQIEVLLPVTPGENISKAGEDVRRGETVLRKGTRIAAQDIGMFAALRLSEVQVIRRPRVAVLCTGSELSELGEPPQEGKIVNTNRFVLSALVNEVGGSVLYLGIAEDSTREIRRRIERGLAEADIVLVTGGTSVGEMDLVPEAIGLLGKPGILVHGVSMRPGMPTGLASVNGKAVISLPGQPVAAMMAFRTFVRPLILRLLGTEDSPVPTVRAKVTRRVASALGMKTFLRVTVSESNGEYIADPVSASGSGLLSTMTQANGIVVIPEDREGVEAGEEVEVELFRPIERRRHG
jgi:molybdopterin molybdotransferase